MTGMQRQVIGLISDTHGLLRPEALVALAGSDLILHAGDIGHPELLHKLEQLAPVLAIRGNVDRAAWASSIPHTRMVELAGATRLHMLHSLQDLDIDPVAAGVRVVLSGHSHKPGTVWKGDVLYINPGSAGPRRFVLPVTVGRLVIDAGKVSAEILPLSV